ncbi:hypothetical protein PR202_gb27814 [Eleusine coracana subsp. coracana]|uniref:Uncharacterized protein n=1 Tax=Eleusine coracana subsp. coracana TaxID=191504 RepID=A0AAV5FW08_ELECO|nr:hypothetical protein PR202_gb27814 [Eleusine coracana subsp. coracana]
MSSTAFIEPLPVIEFVAQILGKDVMSRPLSDANRVKIKKALRGVKVEVTHRGNVRRKYRISGVTAQPTHELIILQRNVWVHHPATPPSLPYGRKPEEGKLSTDGGRRRGGRGRAKPATEPRPAPAPPVRTVIGPPVPSKSLTFCRRPGFGTVGARCVVKANHFLAELPDKDLTQYDVKITPEVSSRSVNRAIIAELVRLYRASDLGMRLPAYDGRKILYTAGTLPFDAREFVVRLTPKTKTTAPASHQGRGSTGSLSSSRARADLHHLPSVSSSPGARRTRRRRPLQVLDIVLRELGNQRYVAIGRSFYSPDIRKPQRLGDGPTFVVRVLPEHPADPDGTVTQHCFPIDDQMNMKSVVEYFKEMYGFTIQQPHLPCLMVGNQKKANYLPMEACKIVEGQRYTKRLNEKQITSLLKVTCQRPREQEMDILQLKYHDAGKEKECLPQVGQWNMVNKEFNSEPVMPIYSARPDQVMKALKHVYNIALNKLKGKELELLLAILPDNNGPLYGDIKRICETDLGLISQCCLTKHVFKISKQYLANVSLKINVKVVASQDWPEVTKYAGLVCAQAHRQELIQDLYKTWHDPQKGTVTGGMIRELLISFRKATGQKPLRIIFYRDGVSEGQFYQVLLYELDAIRKACASLEPNYQPPVTFVVVQKRHHTRLFANNHKDRSSTDKSGNILPVPPAYYAHLAAFRARFYMEPEVSENQTSKNSNGTNGTSVKPLPAVKEKVKRVMFYC